MNQSFNIFTSVLSSTLRGWSGTSSSRSVTQPEQDLILFDQEGCPECRLVREALTELNLDVIIAPCPIGGRNLRKLKRDSGSDTIPLLVDNNTGEKIRGAVDIVPYLYETYRDKPEPRHLALNRMNQLSSKLASLLRFNSGTKAKPSRTAKEPLTLYSFESSPYSRPVRERLCEYELPYKLINLGKQQWADMGPAKARFSLKPYKPLPNTKRDAFFKAHGNVQVPYLVDPNTDSALFESKDILAYLDKTYGA